MTKKQVSEPEAEKLAEKMQDAWQDWAQASIGQGLLPYAEAILKAQEAVAQRDEARATEVARLQGDIAALKNVLRGDESQMKQWAKRNLEMRNDLDRTVLARDEARAEVERLRAALSDLLESPASFEDSRIDYAERQVDTRAWDEAKAALAGRPGAELALRQHEMLPLAGRATTGACQVSEPETLEQIAERLAPPHSEVCRSHASGVCDCWRTRQRIAILAALLEAEALGEQRAAALGGALLDSAIERAEKAEAEVARLKEMLRHYGMVCDNPDQCLLDDDTKEQP